MKGFDMKILIVNKFLHPNGGSETYIFKLGEQLKSMGHEVQYFGMEHEGRIVGNRAECYTADMDFHGGGLRRLLYPFRIIYSREAAVKLRRVLDDLEPDVVHLNNFNFQLTPSVIYAVRRWDKRRGRKTALVYTAHDSQWVCPNHLMLIPGTGERCFACKGARYGSCVKNRCIHDSLIKSVLAALEARIYHGLKTYRKVDAVICPSRFMADRLATDMILEDKLKTIYNFLDKDLTQDTGKKDYVLYFGRFSEEKGVRTLLAACKALPDIPFVFVGNGPLDDGIHEPNIRKLGFLKGKELAKAISEARFSIFPSECYENCPFTVMESISYGTPVIAADIGGVPELVQNGVTGELFEPGNVEELTDKIRNLWGDPSLCGRYAAACRSVSFDSVETYCNKLLEIYRGVLNG